MAANAQTPTTVLQEAFERLQGSVNPQDARDFQSTTLKDVWRAALDIERQQRQRASLRNMRKIEPFLKAIEIYSKSLDTLCNGTPFLPWVWVRDSPTERVSP